MDVEGIMSGVDLIVWANESFDFVIRIIQDLTHGMAQMSRSFVVVQAFFSNIEIVDFTIFPNSCEGPVLSMLIVPEEIDPVTRWIGNPNEMIVTLMFFANVWVILKHHA